jgi:hypothetical protein
MDYTCPVWRSTACSHIKKLQVLQSKCLHIATNAPWYIGNRQIHDDLGVPYFSDHIRSLERFDSKLAGVGKPLVGQLGRHLRWLSVEPKTCQLALFRLPWLRFSTIFLSCKANVRVKLTRQGTAHISKLGKSIYKVSPLLILVWPLWVRIPESLPTKVAPPK